MGSAIDGIGNFLIADLPKTSLVSPERDWAYSGSERRSPGQDTELRVDGGREFIFTPQ